MGGKGCVCGFVALCDYLFYLIALSNVFDNGENEFTQWT